MRKKRKKNQQNWQKEKEKRDWFKKLSKGGLSRIWVIKKYYLHVRKGGDFLRSEASESH
ncbi:MAG: hypothetical protein ACYC2U_05190 [Candidatus Amoebophilus sp.]